jgi:hypothetical protein
MSNYLHSKSVFDALPGFHGDAAVPIAGETASQRAAEERAVDFALRSVKLPDGMLARLRKFIETMPDEIADQVDWLSC